MKLLCLLLLALPLAAQDVVVFVIDDISDEDVDAIPTPNIDSLAAQGRRFRRAYSLPTCSPTRASMLFGRIELEPTQAACTQTIVFPRTLSLPDFFDCSVAFGKWHIGTVPSGPWERTAQYHGFDDWRAGLGANVGSCGGSSYFSWTRVESGVSFNETVYQTEAVRDSFLAWWNGDAKRAYAGSRFAWISFCAVHPPFHSPPAYMLPSSYPKPSRFASDRAKWEAMVVSLDFALGQILAEINMNTTTVVFIGDNGTPNRVARIPEHAKFTTYELGVRVPLIITQPGMLQPGVETRALAHVVDLFATLGGESDNHPDSFSLAGPLSDPASVGLRTWVYTARDSRTAGTIPNWGEGLFDQAVIGPRWKLRNVDGQEFLYDLCNDPDESSPLPPEGPEAEALRAVLR